MNTAIAIAVVLAVIAVLLHLWMTWRANYNANQSRRYVSRLVNDQQNAIRYTKTGEIEWQADAAEVPTFETLA